MFKIYISLFVFLALGCVEPKANLGVYYDLETELNQQMNFLVDGGYKLQKTVKIGDKSETKLFMPDSTEWQSHFDILKDFSPAIPSLVGAFDISSQGSEELYTLKEKQKSALKSFSINRNGSQKSIIGTLHDDKTIYVDFKNVVIQFDENRIRYFKLDGYQKMMLKDTIHYTIEAKVISQ